MNSAGETRRTDKNSRNFSSVGAAAADVKSRATKTIKKISNNEELHKMAEKVQVNADKLKVLNAVMEKIEKDARDAKAEKKIIMFAWVAIAAGTAMFILGKVFKGNPLLDFLNGALPWVFLGLMFLFAVLYLNKEEKK